MKPKTNYVSQNSFCRNKSNYVDQVHFCWRKAIILVKQNYAGKQLYWPKAIIMTLPIILVKKQLSVPYDNGNQKQLYGCGACSLGFLTQKSFIRIFLNSKLLVSN